MAKRFTATEKWLDPWFCGLSDTNKLFWIYLLDNCDHAGIWQVNWPLVGFHVKGTIEIEAFGGRIVRLNDERWFIPKFIDFQYGELNPSNNAHRSVLSILQKAGAYEPLKSPSQGAQDKDMDTDKKKDSPSYLYSEDFEMFWKEYPLKVGKMGAYKSWQKHKPALQAVVSALAWQRFSPDWTKEDGKYIPHPSTYINQHRWNDEPKQAQYGSHSAPQPGKYAAFDKASEEAAKAVSEVDHDVF